MTDQQDRWDEVGQQFSELGRRVKERYEQRKSSEAAADEDQVRDALRKLTEALDQAFTAVGDAIRDPGFREDVARAAGSFGTALGDSLTELGDDISRRFGRREGRREG